MAFIITVLALAGLVLGVLFAFRGSLLTGCAALLVVNYCFGHLFFHFDLGPLPLTIDRLLLAALVAAFAIQWWLGRVQLKPLTWIDVSVILFTLTLVASTFLHDWQLDRPGKISPLWLLVAGYLAPAALYFVARNAPVDERGLGRVYTLLALFGCYLALTALAEITKQWWAVFPTYISNPKLGIHYGRARGPLLQSHSLGLYLCMCLLGVWALRTYLGRHAQLAVYAVIPLFMAAIYFTYTRCIWMAAGAEILIVLTLSTRGAWRPLLLASVSAAGLLVAMAGWSSIVGIEREAGATAARDSVSQRGAFTYVSWKMFLDRPLWGVGFGQFTSAKLPYLSDRSVPLELEAIREQPHHNTFLSLLTEVGLIGLGLYLLILYGWTRTAWQMWNSPTAPHYVRTQGLVMLAAIGIYLCPALFFDLTYSPADHWIFFFLGGLTMALAPQRAAQPARSAQPYAKPTLLTHG